MKFIGYGSIDDYESACIVVEMNMHTLKREVKKAREIMKDNKFIQMVELSASDPDEIDSEIFDDLELESYELHPFRGEYKVETEHCLRYGRITVSPWFVSYKCSPKHWPDSTLSLTMDVET
tara:strand:- start:322 stop:684 length:363 start_codon:yes stop_codon:yes gene_type:complete